MLKRLPEARKKPQASIIINPLFLRIYPEITFRLHGLSVRQWKMVFGMLQSQRSRPRT